MKTCGTNGVHGQLVLLNVVLVKKSVDANVKRSGQKTLPLRVARVQQLKRSHVLNGHAVHGARGQSGALAVMIVEVDNEFGREFVEDLAILAMQLANVLEKALSEKAATPIDALRHLRPVMRRYHHGMRLPGI